MQLQSCILRLLFLPMILLRELRHKCTEYVNLPRVEKYALHATNTKKILPGKTVSLSTIKPDHSATKSRRSSHATESRFKLKSTIGLPPHSQHTRDNKKRDHGRKENSNTYHIFLANYKKKIFDLGFFPPMNLSHLDQDFQRDRTSQITNK